MIQIEDKIKFTLAVVVIGLGYGLTYSLVSYATPAINDDTVTAVVKSDLANDLGTNAANIYVITSGGVVTLRGTVPTADEKDEAEEITRDATGVTEVVNHIQVNSVVNAGLVKPNPE